MFSQLVVKGVERDCPLTEFEVSSKRERCSWVRHGEFLIIRSFSLLSFSLVYSLAVGRFILCDYNTAKNILRKIQNLNSKFLFLGRIEIVTGIVKIGLKIETENVIEEIESGRGRKKRRRNCELRLMLCLSVLDYHL